MFRSWRRSRKEPKLSAGAGIVSFGSYFWLQVRIKQQIEIIIHIEQDKVSELCHYSFLLKKCKNLLLDLKAVLTTNYKAEIGASSGAKLFESQRRSWSFSFTTLPLSSSVAEPKLFVPAPTFKKFPLRLQSRLRLKLCGYLFSQLFNEKVDFHDFQERISTLFTF